jgi:hypothetical protein
VEGGGGGGIGEERERGDGMFVIRGKNMGPAHEGIRIHPSDSTEMEEEREWRGKGGVETERERYCD